MKLLLDTHAFIWRDGSPLTEGWPVVSHDPLIAQYPVTVIW